MIILIHIKGDKNLEFIYNIINGTLISKMGEELVKKFKIQDKILFKNEQNSIVNKNIKEKLLHELHDCKLALHQGIERTYEYIKKLYYWNNLKDEC